MPPQSANDPGSREDEFFRLALSIADGIPLSADEITEVDSGGESYEIQKREYLLLDRVAQQFRKSLGDLFAVKPAKILFRFGSLDVLAKLGEGSYGEIYSAFDPMLQQEVALKMLKSDGDLSTSIFLEEARSLAQLRHPNILSIYGASVENGNAGLWGELVRGSSLRDIVAADGPLSPDETRAVALELCQALSYIHRRGWTHGDIKPENIMRDDFGRIVLTDFGCARAFSREHSAILRGSLSYLAPEVIRGGPTTASSDIFALGVTLFFLLTGKLPYRTEELQGLEGGEPTSAPSLRARVPGAPPSLCSAIEQAISFDPKRRYRTGLAFAAALGSNTSPRRHVVAVCATATVVAGLIALFGLSFIRHPPAWKSDLALYKSTDKGYISLTDGETVRVGEGVALQFSSTRPTYLYVIDDDGSRTPTVLFPSGKLSQSNPLPAGKAIRLPGESAEGKSRDWQVDGNSATDHLVILAGASPLTAVEAMIGDWSQQNQASTKTAEQLRGMHKLIPARDDKQSALNTVVSELEPLRAKGEVQYWNFTLLHSENSP